MLLDRSRVYILPSPQGIILGVLVLVMVTGALNFDNSLGLLLSFLLAGLAVIAIFHTWSNLVGLTFQVGRIEPVFAGDTARVALRVENLTRRSRSAVRVKRAGQTPPPSGDIPAAGASLTLTLPTTRRGLLPLGRLTVETRFPLGLFRAWGHVEFEQTCTVYPKPGPSRPFPEEVGGDGSLRGSRGAGDEDFCDLRPYVPGDPPRTLHWKASARSDRLLVKRFEGETEGVLRLDWDAVDDSDPEARLSQLCRWVLDAHRSGAVWGLRLPNADIEPRRGDEHFHRCLRALALFETP